MTIFWSFVFACVIVYCVYGFLVDVGVIKKK